MFYVTCTENHNPTSNTEAYGHERWEIEEFEDSDTPPQDGSRNNYYVTYYGPFDTLEEAEEELAKQAPDYEVMGPERTENYLYESVQSSITSETTDKEIYRMVNEWCSEPDGEGEVPDSDIAYEMAIKHRDELREEEEED